MATLGRGVRAIAVGAFRTRTWREQDVERPRLEIVADEVGPSLRWTIADVTKSTSRA